MVCLILTELIAERGRDFESAVRDALSELLPSQIVSDRDLTLERLVSMQSGLRDYWALTVLWGATPQDRFSIYQDAPEALKRIGGFHFAPGTQMSYCNTNFAAVGLAIEKATGQTLGDLLHTRLFGPVGMKTAVLRPDTARIPAPLIGYEGSETTGYIAYSNRIEWAGDAGIQASLEDMIAYEKYVHRNSTVETSAYYKNAQEPKYIDDEPANYGFGLVHGTVEEGVTTIGHSGGLAGFRLRRTYAPTEGLSVIVLLNSETDTKAVTDHVFKKLLTASSTAQPLDSNDRSTQEKLEVSWQGNYFDDEAKLAVVVRQDKPGEVAVNYAGHDEKLKVQSENKATSKEMQVSFENGELKIARPLEHRTFTVRQLEVTPASSDASMFVGKYYSQEIDSTFHVTGSGAMLYGTFDGYLGKGPAHLMRRLGKDIWWLACFRSLDSPVPGNWTIAFSSNKDEQGVNGVTVGCWLAREVRYKKIG